MQCEVVTQHQCQFHDVKHWDPTNRQQQKLTTRRAGRFGKASNGNQVELSNTGSWKVFAKALQHPRASQRSLQWDFAARRFKVSRLGEPSLHDTKFRTVAACGVKAVPNILLIHQRNSMKQRCPVQCEVVMQHQCQFHDVKHWDPANRQQQNLITRPAGRFGKVSSGNQAELSNAGSWKVFAKALQHPRASQRSLPWDSAARRFKVSRLGEHSRDMTQNSEQLLLILSRHCQRWQQ